jgi:UDP-N-acetylmuramate dehydrogenase
MTSPYKLSRNASLARHNTFRVPVRAVLLAEVNDPRSLVELLALPVIRERPLLVLGDGSNVLFTRDFDGVVVLVNAHGIEQLSDDGDSVRLRAAAGENWNGLVRWSLKQGLCGLENLSLIPGRVGAAPIQNIGAYGAELAETLVSVEVHDLLSHEYVHISRAECGFSYRDSIFKRLPDRWIVTAIELRLYRSAPLKLDYAGVREELAAMQVTEPSAVDVSQAVCRLRQRKLPDPATIGNAGSFFKNPVVSLRQAADLQDRYPGLPSFDAPSGKKLSAAWMIEKCEWKGYREGDTGVSGKHALVLVNHGGATGAQIWALAQRIQDSVEQKFGIRLEPEPKVI